jgi:hypothetical protein
MPQQGCADGMWTAIHEDDVNDVLTEEMQGDKSA